MKQYLFLLILISSCESTSNLPTIKTASSFFPDQKAKVLVVGTFHFNYPGRDTHKTIDDNKIDVLAEPKKSEIVELAEYIKRFKPTKIAIEAFPDFKATEKLREYKTGQHRDKRDERFQLAMRIANDLNFDTLYAVDDSNFQKELWDYDTVLYNNFLGEVNWNREDSLWEYVEEWWDYEDQLVKKVSLLDYFKYQNTRQYHQYDYGMYLIGKFKTENNQGADHLSMWWYNRNLRIFRNIIGITESTDDRILVIMGNGHAAVLRQFFECSANYEFIEFGSM